MTDPRHPIPPQSPHGQPHATPQHAPHTPHPGHPQAPRAPMAPGHQQPARPGIPAMPVMKPPQDDLEPIELVDDEPPPAFPSTTPTAGVAAHHGPPPVKKIKAFGVDEHRAQHAWKRQPVRTGTGACRVRSFHGKYSEQGLEYLDNAVNEWLDSHPEVEVKFVTSTVMTFEGKIREPALVLNVWY